MSENVSPKLQELVRSIYCSPEVADLETRIKRLDEEVYRNESLRPAVREMLEHRRMVLNERFVYTDETAQLLREFNRCLKEAIIRAQRHCRQTYEDLRKNAPFGNNDRLEVWTSVDFAGYPALHPARPADDEKELPLVWEMITSAAYSTTFDNRYYGFEKFRDGFCDKDESALFGLSSADDNWNEHLPEEWSHGMGLVMQFHTLYDHSLMSLYDLIFVRDFTLYTLIEYPQELSRNKKHNEDHQ